MASTSDLTAVSQLIATALLPFVQQSPSPEHHPRHLAQLAALSTGGASNLINAQAWLGQIIWDLLLSLQNDNFTLSLSSDTYSKAETDALLLRELGPRHARRVLHDPEINDAIRAALGNYFTEAEVTANLVNAYTDTQLLNYSDAAAMNQAIADADRGLRRTNAQVLALIAGELVLYWDQSEAQVLALIAGELVLYWDQSEAEADGRFLRTNHLEPLDAMQAQVLALIAGELVLYWDQSEAPLVGDAILGNQSTLRFRCDSWTKAEADGRFLRTNHLEPLDAMQAEADGRFLRTNHLEPLDAMQVLCHRSRRRGRWHLQLSPNPIMGGSSGTSCAKPPSRPSPSWATAARSRSPATAGRTAPSSVTPIDSRVTTLENSGGVAPTADITVNSLTATSFVVTPLLQSAAADLQIRNASTSISAEDGALLANFTAAGITLNQDITVNAAKTPNATTADFAQLLVGACRNGHLQQQQQRPANLEVVSNLRVEAPLLRCDPAESVLNSWGTNGTGGQPAVSDAVRRQ
eukprot:s8019_g3.t1